METYPYRLSRPQWWYIALFTLFMAIGVVGEILYVRETVMIINARLRANETRVFEMENLLKLENTMPASAKDKKGL